LHSSLGLKAWQQAGEKLVPGPPEAARKRKKERRQMRMRAK
jgi:hypothetical protein